MEKLAEMIARLLADGVDPNRLIGFVPGPDLPVLEGHSMHCSGVTLLAEIKGDRIVEFDKHLPYAFLHVEATTLPRSAVAVINKGDFKNVWTIHESGWFGKGFTVVVEYNPIAPKFLSFMKKALPIFEFSVLGPDSSIVQMHGLKRRNI